MVPAEQKAVDIIVGILTLSSKLAAYDPIEVAEYIERTDRAYVMDSLRRQGPWLFDWLRTVMAEDDARRAQPVRLVPPDRRGSA